MTDVIRQHIEIVEGAGGPKARITGHRIRVVDIVNMHKGQGLSPAEIVEQLPTITLADVHAALAYYYDHRDEIDWRTAEDEAFVEQFRRENPGRLEEIKQRRGG
ncbi:MAG: DUF433 domain-containing protein [Chloroflexota bacterium]|nr:DUF433 domain-containing protein [Chloroflexota bacterium]